MKLAFRSLLGAVAVLLMAALCGCGRDSPEAQIASAKQYMTKGQLKSAAIQLKNTLQADPNLAEARFLLGKALLDGGDPVGAAVELRKAQELKYAQDSIAPLMARALVRQGNAKKALDEFGQAALSDPVATADLKTALAMAHAAVGQRDQAEAALKGALASVPGHAPALLFKASMTAKASPTAAMEIVDQVLRALPADADAWMVKGDLLAQAKADSKEVVEAYRKVAAARPEDLPSRWALLGVYSSLNDLKAARKQLDELKQLEPQHPQTRFFEASLALQQGDLKVAQEMIQSLLKIASDNATVLQLAGTIELKRGATLEAERHLNRALYLAPGLPGARLALAQLHLQSGQPAKALAILEPLLAEKEPPPQALSLAGAAYLRNGAAERAEKLFNRALAANPDDPKSRAALAVAQLYGKDSEAAVAELGSLADTDAGTTADLALIGASLRRKDFPAALKALERLEKKLPGKALPFNLRGMVLYAAGDLKGARESYERAVRIDPAYFAAVERLAALDILEKRPADAEKRFENAIKAQANNPRPFMALARLKGSSGKNKAEVTELLSKAVKASPSAVMPRLMLVDHHLRHREARLALIAAQDALVAAPESPLLVDALGRSQLASGEFNQAVSSFSKLATLRPDSPQAAIGLANAYVGKGDATAARQQLKRALELVPDYVDAQQKLIALELIAGHRSEALAIARKVQAQRPQLAAGYLYEGNVEAAGKKWGPAAAAYRRAFEREPTTDTAEKLHAALRAKDSKAEADEVAKQWLEGHPRDAAFIYYLGNSAMVRGEYQTAEGHFLEVIKLAPDFAPALNNLAWTMAKLNKPQALSYIERANKLRPDQPAFLDTWVMILVEQNKLDKAIELQEKAVNLQPKNATQRLALARIYLKAGKKSLAKQELDRLYEPDRQSPLQKEVQQLRAQL